MLRLILLAALPAVLATAAPVPSCELLPGWRQQGPRRGYQADNLFDYMNGNAEGYLIYGFVRMDGVTCAKGGAKVIIDVSEMQDDESAYGLFASNFDPRQPMTKVGVAGQFLPRKAFLVKGKHFAEIAADSEAAAPEMMAEFARAMEKSLEGTTAPPAVLGWFPPEKLSPGAVRLVPQSVLGMRLLRRGWLAQYDSGKAFLVPEGSPDAAAAVMRKLRERFGQVEPASIAEEAFRGTDKYLGRLCVFRKGRFVGGFANVADGADPVALASAFAARVP